MNGRELMVVAVAALVLATGCDKKDDKPAGTGTASASSAAMNTTPPPAPTPASANAKPFTVQADGKLSVDMPAPNEHIKATATNSAGELSIDFANLATSSSIESS